MCLQKIENEKLVGSMLAQDIDSISLAGKRKLWYFCPNNVAILLSVSSKALESARKVFETYMQNKDREIELDKASGDKKKFLNDSSKVVCDYIEDIQTAIIFGYTALETFANLSIPDGFTHEVTNERKGTTEVYDKRAIERWLPLNTKLSVILRQVYKTTKVQSQKGWGRYTNLENYRNDIIHQKSVNNTEFYKTYFRKTIFSICESPLAIIRFYYNAHAKNNQTNPLWPWLVNEDNHFPVNTEWDQWDIEVVGNLHQGMSRKPNR